LMTQRVRVGSSALLAACYEGELLRMLDRRDREIHVEIRPIQVIRARPLHAKNLAHCCVAKPWKMGRGKKQLSIAEEDPDAVRRNVCDLNP